MGLPQSLEEAGVLILKSPVAGGIMESSLASQAQRRRFLVFIGSLGHKSKSSSIIAP